MLILKKILTVQNDIELKVKALCFPAPLFYFRKGTTTIIIWTFSFWYLMHVVKYNMHVHCLSFFLTTWYHTVSYCSALGPFKLYNMFGLLFMVVHADRPILFNNWKMLYYRGVFISLANAQCSQTMCQAHFQTLRIQNWIKQNPCFTKTTVYYILTFEGLAY